MEPRKKLELTPEEQEAEKRDAAIMAVARAMNPNPAPINELFSTAVRVPDLIYWSRIGRLFKVKLAINNGADLNEIGPSGTTALHDAAINGHLDVVRLLVEQGADVGLRCREGFTALELAREAGCDEVTAYLETLAKQTEPGNGRDGQIT